MRSYVPNTEKERLEMLHDIGMNSMDDLFRDIPEDLKLKKPLDLPKPLSETELRDLIHGFVYMNEEGGPLFRGAGAYRHYIPSVVPQLAMRSEFYTAYTPYQAEMSQGMLQSLFEYQTVICRLTGLDAANASVYDGATAAAEAMLMLRDNKRKKKILYSAALNPDVITVMKTYAHCAGLELVEIPVTDKGVTDKAAVAANMDGAAGCIAANPNYYGCIEPMAELAETVHAANGLFVAYVNPISLGVLKRPADYGADIAIGDGQPLGLPMAFGGPYVGFMAATKKLMRNLPGRIAGQTTDAEGNRVFVLTLQAREQHIRREMASSNICSNQMLCAIMASMYCCVMGPKGMREVAEQNIAKAHELAKKLTALDGVKLRYPDTPFFNEFVIDVEDAAEIDKALANYSITGGLVLPDGGMLWCATEMNNTEEFDFVCDLIEDTLDPMGGEE
ncbi:MAG: aminomethyl-transferring glycine dehydrogenase subunit GcvPA [Clostridiales bacterium]|nr:aminomethyl-transferring glycine dehydrogenase subunit GcvPA [Clostridiales bacterium]